MTSADTKSSRSPAFLGNSVHLRRGHLPLICAGLSLIILTPVQDFAYGKTESKFCVVTKKKRRVCGAGLSADAKGNVSLTLGAGARQTFKVGSYAYAECPKPRELRTAEKLVKARRFSEAQSLLENVYSTHRFLGWAERIALLKARILRDQSDLDRAEEVIRDGLEYPMRREQRSRLRIVLLELLIAQGRQADADEVLKGFDPRKPEMAVRLNDIRGRILLARGQKQEAVLQYMKTVLLYPDAGEPRKAAYERVLTLLKELEHPRYPEFEKKFREEYN